MFLFRFVFIIRWLLQVRRDDVLSERARYRVAVVWTCVYFFSACAFGVGVMRFRGSQAGFEFYTSYFVEQSLSVDNLFVFVLIFQYFQVYCSIYLEGGGSGRDILSRHRSHRSFRAECLRGESGARS